MIEQKGLGKNLYYAGGYYKTYYGAPTENVEATVAQILRLEQAGCEIIRSTANNESAAKAFSEIKKYIHIPIVADIHFDYRLAIMAIENGADKVIVTSYVFKDGEIQYDNLNKLILAVGKEQVVLDLSCRKKEGKYYIVTDRWQKFTNVEVTHEVLGELSAYCSEFLIHAVDVEGKQQGIDTQLIAYLGEWDGIPITYAGGIHTYENIETIAKLGKGKIHVTVGSALDLFGGSLEFDKLVQLMQ